MHTAVQNQATRDNNLDLLRLLSCIAVIVVHVNWMYFSEFAYTPSWTLKYIGGSLLNIVTRFCVPCFVMLSGAFLLHGEKNAIIGSFYKRMFPKTFIPFLLVTFVFFMKSIISKAVNPAESVIDSFRILFTSGFSTHWYMYMLAGLYLLTPFLVRVKGTLTTKQWSYVGIVLMIWAIFSQATSTQTASGSIGVVFAYLSYFVLGNVLYEKSITQGKDKSKVFKYGALALLIDLSLLAIRFIWGDVNDGRWILNPYSNFFSPFVVLSSVCVFSAFLNLTINRDYSWIAKHTLMIYLVHGGVYPLLKIIIGIVLPNGVFASIFLISTATFAISLVISVIYNRAERILYKKKI